MSLKNRISVVFLTLMFAGIWGLATRLAYVLEKDLTQSLSNQMSGTVDYVARELDSEIELRIDALKSTAQMATPDILTSPDKIQRYLSHHATTYRLFSYGLQVLDTKGAVIGMYPFKEKRLGFSRADREYFKDTIASGKAVVGVPVRGRLSAEPLLSMAVPIRDPGGDIVAILVGTIPLSDNNLFGELEQTRIGRSGYFVIVSRKARLIVSATDKRRLLQPAPARGVNPLFDRRMDEGYEAPGVTVSSLGDEVFTVSRNMKTTDWLVLAGLKTDEAFAPIVTLKREIFGLALLLSILVALALRFVLAKQLAALDEAARSIRQITSGEAPFAPLPMRSDDEIGMLVDSFNRLAVRRQVLDEELQRQRELYETLLKAQSKIGEGALLIERERVTFANDALCRLCGYTPDEIKALKPFSLLFHPDDRDRVLINHRRRLHGEQLPHRYEAAILTHDGRRLEVEVAVAVMQSSAAPPTVVVVMADITERKRMQSALLRATEDLELRVVERTAALNLANQSLSDEIAERRRLEQEIIAVSEEGQRHIGQELHDGLGQLLTGVAFICKGMEKSLVSRGQPEAAAASKVVQLVAEAVDQTRQLARGLYPVEVEAQGLMSALEMLTARTREIFKVGCSFRCDKPALVNDHISAINFYRIAQEAISNAVKHGKARTILVTLSSADGPIRLTVTDDGIGIDPANAAQRPGMGLHIMRYRANMVGATLDVRNIIGGGTEVVAYQYA